MLAFWENRTIKAKLLLGIGAILSIFAVSSVIVLCFVNGLASSSQYALRQTVPTRAAALRTQYRLIDADDNAAYYVMDRKRADWASYIRNFELDVAAVKTALPELSNGAETTRERDTLKAFETWFDSDLNATDHSFRLKLAGKYDDAVKDFLSFDTTKGQSLIADFAASMTSHTDVATAQVDASSRAAFVATIAGALTAIFAGAIIAFTLGGAISRRLQTVTHAIEDVVRVDFTALTAAMQRFATGDLSARVESKRAALAVRGSDETAALARSYNKLVEGIGIFGAELTTTGEVLTSIIGETKATVDASANGDFTTRLNTATQRGVFKELGENLNRLMDICNVSLGDIARVLSALANGDLTEKITNTYGGTFNRLKDDANATVTSLTRTVGEIKVAAETVSTSAREISAGNTDLSQRTEEQASSLEETAASMEQLTATVRQNADNAKQANSLAVGASDIAVKGGQVVGEVVQTMLAIDESGKKIVDIISVIDGIAFQTNILALNAAVEAARAGEQGRGFAVVAGEVRTLAQRSAAAAKEIKTLIGDSVEKTAAGTRLVGQAGTTMAEIVESVKRVTDIMAAIAAASLQQGSGIGQVNEAVAQMDKVTQQNAALVEQIAASAETLEERARGLVDLVSVFHLAGDGSQATARPVSAAHAALPAPKHKKAGTGTAVASRQAKAAPVEDNDAEWSSF